MLIKIISLNFNSALCDFDDTVLRDFIKDKEVISIHEYFFVQNQLPYITLVIQYLPLRQEIDPKMNPQGKREELWRNTLSQPDMGLFNLLRDWRTQRCKKEGLPPYVLFTNQQLAQIVKTRPQSLVDLMKIEGVGKAKLDKYGSDILEITKINLGLQDQVSQQEFKGENHADSADTPS